MDKRDITFSDMGALASMLELDPFGITQFLGMLSPEKRVLLYERLTRPLPPTMPQPVPPGDE